MSWYVNIVNHLATGEMPCDWSSQDKKKFLIEVKNFYWMTHTCSSTILLNFFENAYQTTR